MFGYLHESVHGPRDRGPRILEGFLERGGVCLALTEDRDCRGLLLQGVKQVARGLIKALDVALMLWRGLEVEKLAGCQLGLRGHKL